MIIKSNKLTKEIIVENNKIIGCKITNEITKNTLELFDYKEFEISYFVKITPLKKQTKLIDNSMFDLQINNDILLFTGKIDENTWNITVKYFVDSKNDTIKKSIKIDVDNNDLILDYLTFDSFRFNAKYCWTIPEITDRVYVPNRIFTLGQPYYVSDLFFGGEFPTMENRIKDNIASSKYYFGRTFKEIMGTRYENVDFVIGAGIGSTFDKLRSSFFDYISTIAQPAKFRVQYNSWYDNMLDITTDKIKSSFTEVADNFKKQGFRPLDCYVVDDGWTDYKTAKFWDFNKEHFPNEFYNERELTEKLGSTFGVWFGPRGGYTTQTVKYAGLLTKIGYNKCRQSFDICTGDPKYIADLTYKMVDFCNRFNVSYYKIDGFATTPCKSSKHGHPKGVGDGIYFYTFLWEEWIKGFEKIRTVKPDIFLNITSYAHPSPWFLIWVNAMWLNNCGDMGYEGKGDNLSQCLNYRDGKYRDFFEKRQLQFPVAYLYNHEPCYAERNYNPPLPNKMHKTVIYDYDEFEKYMYMCMMRGTGFVELYFSPSMFDERRWQIATKVLSWAEQNFDIIKNSQFFGEEPKVGNVYGYYAKQDKKAIMIVRNSDDNIREFKLDNQALSFDNNSYKIAEYYPTSTDSVRVENNDYTLTLNPFEIKIYYIDID